MRRSVGAALAFIAAAPIVGCGHADISPAEFRQRADAICRKYRRETDRSPRRADSPRGAAAPADKDEPLIERGMTELRGLDAPERLQALYDRYLRDLDSTRARQRKQFTAALRHRGRSRYERLIRLINESTEDSRRQARLARRLGLSRCFTDG